MVLIQLDPGSFLFLITQRLIHGARAEALQIKGNIDVAELFEASDNFFAELFVEQLGKLFWRDFNTSYGIVTAEPQRRKPSLEQEILSCFHPRKLLDSQALAIWESAG